MEKLNENRTSQNRVLHIHWSQLSAADQRQAHRVVGGGKHNKPRQTKCVTTVLDFDLNDPNLSSTSGVHVWFHRCSRHALAMHLKRTNELIPLLKRHLAGTSIGLRTISNQIEEKQRQDSCTVDLSLATNHSDNQDRDFVQIELS